MAPVSPDGSDPDPVDTAAWTIGVRSAPSELTAPPLPVLTELRAGTHPDYERVTFEISGEAGGRPGYRVEYVDRPLVECGSGNQIFPVGDGWLEVRLEPAAAHTEDGRPTLGSREIDVDGPLLERIYRTCDFEGIVTHVLALASPNAYRVLTLQDPWRIVVDVRR
ncbi:MAG: AMIN-like domain-containing (lipo)protein [Gemmatimonadota bacterium]